MDKLVGSVVEIDGAQGEGGGQIFRTALTLSMCLGKPIRINRIRAGRQKPGLLRQHLTCLRAAQAICGAELTGAELGSTEVSFSPGPVVPGQYEFAVGSAGSTTLVFQTILLPLALAAGKTGGAVSEVTFEGGTHNHFAPSYDFIRMSFLPLMALMGLRVDTEFMRYGFFPAGGGAWRAIIHPVEHLNVLSLIEQPVVDAVDVHALSAGIAEHVGERELRAVRRKALSPCPTFEQHLVNAAGPGNVLSVSLKLADHCVVFDSIGDIGVTAERVAGRAVREARRFMAAKVQVDEHLADQLLLPLALGSGGRFTTLEPTQHLRTNIAVIAQLMGGKIDLLERGEDQYEVCVLSR